MGNWFSFVLYINDFSLERFSSSIQKVISTLNGFKIQGFFFFFQNVCQLGDLWKENIHNQVLKLSSWNLQTMFQPGWTIGSTWRHSNMQPSCPQNQSWSWAFLKNGNFQAGKKQVGASHSFTKIQTLLCHKEKTIEFLHCNFSLTTWITALRRSLGQ